MDTRNERLAKNESIFRNVNERVGEVAATFDLGQADTTVEFVCECSDGACFDQIALTLPEYELVRASPVRFAVQLGHVDTAVEHVLETNERFVTVEKIGEAADTAAELDPRS